VFSDYYKERDKYERKIRSFKELFVNLKDFKFLSKKVIDKKFDLVVLTKLANSNLEELEKTTELALMGPDAAKKSLEKERQKQ